MEAGLILFILCVVVPSVVLNIYHSFVVIPNQEKLLNELIRENSVLRDASSQHIKETEYWRGMVNNLLQSEVDCSHVAITSDTPDEEGNYQVIGITGSCNCTGEPHEFGSFWCYNSL